MIVLINSKRLIESIEFDPLGDAILIYKGIKVGDAILIPEEQKENINSNFVKVTGFNPKHDIVHWCANGKYGGIAHSGTYYDEIIQHIIISY